MMKRRAVVTGIGILCSLGKNYNEFSQALKDGIYGIREIQYFDTSQYKLSKAGVLAEVPEKFEGYDELEDANKFGLYCLEQALDDSGIDLNKYDSERIGVSLASSNAGENSRELFRSWQMNNKLPDIIVESPATLTGLVASKANANGPRVSISTACAAGSNSIGCAYDMIVHDECDVVIAGGIDPLSKLSYSGFLILNTISEERVKPFDEKRKGIDIGEAGIIFIIESLESALARKAKIYAEILGYGISNDAYHTSAPDPEAKGAVIAIEQCLEYSGISHEDVDYINAHGTGTKYNDEMEMLAIKKVFGERAKFIPISSTKSMHGHTLAAAGSLELAATICAIQSKFVPPTITTSHIMEDYKNYCIVTNNKEYEDYEIDVALSNSFGFAGNNTCLAVGRYTDV